MKYKYIDAEKLIAEIERRIYSIENCPLIEAEFGASKKREGKLFAYKELLSLITSLQQEQPEVDLGKEIEKYYYDKFAFISSVHNPTLDILTDIANHFYELGLKARKEE